MWVSAMGESKMPSVWFITFVLLSLLQQVVISQTTTTNQCEPAHTYEHEGRECCMCPPGQFVKEHCSTDLQRRNCDLCPDGTYSNHWNSQISCEQCSSCEQLNANLEEAEPCTPGQDRKCRCKKDHYCDSDTGTCTLCQPCTKCGTAGVKEPCTVNSDTVCNEQTEGINTGLIVGLVILFVLIFVAGGIWVHIRRRRRAGKRQQPTSGQPSNGNINDVELQPLTVPDVDLRPHLSDIAKETGWKVMQDIARRCEIPPATIESCQLDCPNDAYEQTVKLLGIFSDTFGRGGSRKLVLMLQNSGKQAAAEKVVDILSGGNRSNVPV